MNMAIRRLFLETPIARDLYLKARKTYHTRRMQKAAHGYFLNFEDYNHAFDPDGVEEFDLHTKDGLTLTIRRNSMDFPILVEIFLDNCYVHDLFLADRPVIVDIGGYIGDFAIYCARRLNAQRVVTCEPSPHNWVLLKKNVAANHCDDRVIMVNKAVTDGQNVMMNVNAPGRGQARVSAYGHSDEERIPVPGVTLSSLVRDYNLEMIDLLKIDCEGGEYSILLTTPAEVYRRIRNIVFECHEIEGFKTKLEAVKQELRDEGFSLTMRGCLISATRKPLGMASASLN